MYQGMTGADKAYFTDQIQGVMVDFCDLFHFDYDEDNLWEQDYIYVSLFWPLLNKNFDWSSAAISVWLDGVRDTSYSAEDAGWDMSYVLGFESRVEILAEKALKESKTYRIEWEEED